MSDVKKVLDGLAAAVTNVEANETAANVKTKVDEAISTLIGAEVAKYYTVEAVTPSDPMGGEAGTSTLTVTISITSKEPGSSPDTTKSVIITAKSN